MVDHKNGFSIGFMSRNSLFCLFTLTSSIFIFSWFLVLRSAGGRPSQFIDHNPLSDHPKLSATIDNGINSQLRKQNDVQLDSSDSNLRIIPLESVEDHKEEEEEEEEVVVSTEKKLELKACDSKTNSNLPLKVFMYDLSPEFHFELLDWKAEGNSVWPDLAKKVPDYPGGLNLQHSIEYWLTLDLLSSTIPNRMSTSPRAAMRVFNSSEADIIFVPFFSSLSYNRNSKVKTAHKKSKNYLLQDKLVKFLTAQEEWKKSGGRDHIVLAHHPNSMLDARMKLWPAMFILSDFGRYPPNIANVEKDVIAPYKHVIKTFYNDSSGFDDRPTLLYFQGAIYRKDGGFVRQELFYLLKEEKDVHFTFGSVQKDGINKATRGMHGSKFCLNIAGDTPSSNRLFDAIASHCVPVIISDEIELPYEDVIDYSDFCIFVRTSDAVKEKFLINLIRGIKKDEWTRMWNKLKEIEKLFEYQYPSQEGDAVQMIWQAVARKVPLIKLKLHKSWRFSRFEVGGKKTTKVVPWSRSKHLW